MQKKKVFYFCRRGLGKHLQFYTGWVFKARKKGLPIFLFTTVSFKEYFKIESTYKRNEFIFLPCFKVFDKPTIFIFFLIQFLKNKFTVVQLRKRSSGIFSILKLFFSKKFKYIIESEGDIVYELEYLENHPFKNNFYYHILKDKDRIIKNHQRELLTADYIICVSENLRRLYIDRYSINNKKIMALTTGCDSNKFKYDKIIRENYRKKLSINSKFVLIYIGNIYYSWQNISRTLEIYKLIIDLKIKTKLIIITREVDKSIVLYFLKKHKINPSEIILRFSIPNNQIPKYLNASDLGIVLRDDHSMNHVAAPGKFGEYACCGLPILTGRGIADFSEKLTSTSYGIVLEKIHDNKEFIKKFKEFMHYYEKIDRYELSKWGIHNFSFKEYIDKYVNLMTKLLKE